MNHLKVALTIVSLLLPACAGASVDTPNECPHHTTYVGGGPVAAHSGSGESTLELSPAGFAGCMYEGEILRNGAPLGTHVLELASDGAITECAGPEGPCAFAYTHFAPR